MALKYGAQCSQCGAALQAGWQAECRRMPAGQGKGWRFRCGGKGCSEMSLSEESDPGAGGSDSDLDGFIAPEEEEESEGGASASEDSELLGGRSKQRRKPSLLQQKFREFEQEYASGEESERRSVAEEEEEEEEEEEGDDDLVIVGGSDSSGAESGSDAGDRVGKLYCCYCGDYYVEDDFSAQQRRLTRDHERFCLRHTSTASFNSTFKKPERRAIGLRMGPPSSSPGKKDSVQAIGLAAHISPSFCSSGSSSRARQDKLDSYFGSQSKQRSGGSALKRRSLQEELGGSSQTSPASILAAANPDTPKGIPERSRAHATPSSADSLRRRSRVITIDDDEEGAAGGPAEQKATGGEQSDSEEEWDEPVPPSAGRSIENNINGNKKSPKMKSLKKTVSPKRSGYEKYSEDESFHSSDSDEAEYSDSGDSDHGAIGGSESESSFDSSGEPACKRKGKKGVGRNTVARKGSTGGGRVTRASTRRTSPAAARTISTVSSSAKKLNTIASSEAESTEDYSERRLKKSREHSSAMGGRRGADDSDEEWDDPVAHSNSKRRDNIEDSKRNIPSSNSRISASGMNSSRKSTPPSKKRRVVVDDDDSDDGEWKG